MRPTFSNLANKLIQLSQDSWNVRILFETLGQTRQFPHEPKMVVVASSEERASTNHL